MPLLQVTKMSPRTTRLFNRFQTFFLVSVLVFIIEAAGTVALVLTTHPATTSPFFYVPIGILAVTLVAFIVVALVFGIPFFRSGIQDVRRRREGLPSRGEGEG